MQHQDLTLLIHQHMNLIDQAPVLDVGAFTEQIYSKLSAEQRESVRRDRLRNKIIQMGAYRFPVLKW